MEALVRSLLLVFVDNATAEYSFISAFFKGHPTLAPAEPTAPPSAVLSPDGGTFTELLSPSISEFGSKAPMSSTTPGLGGFVSFVAKSKEEQAAIDVIWKQVMDPVMEYCTVRPNQCLLLIVADTCVYRHLSDPHLILFLRLFLFSP